MFKFMLFVGLCTLAESFPHWPEQLSGSGKCGYDSCPVPKPGMLNVHLVPHTHDDVGWLKTVDQYYFGSRTDIQNAGVQYIIDSVVNELLHDPKKKFIYVETAFFWKWWKEQEDHIKHKVKHLVKNGQLEFIGGAWSMNDEATTHYQSVIDQFTWGLRKLNDTFGSCGRPRIGWQIDPFGHSKETASMMAHFGFDGLFFGRLDYQDKENRLERNTMEMIWEGNSILGSSADLLTGALFNFYSAPKNFCFDVLCNDDPIIDDRHSPEFNADARVNDFLAIRSKADIFTGSLFNLYQAPSGFCFDIMCGDEPIVDDKNSPDYNVARRVARFLQYIEWQKLNYRNDQIMITMGGDFNYQDAHYYFKNLEKLIRYVNQRQEKGSKVNVFYSTPSCYVKSLNEANTTWPIKQDDFFPYSSDPHAFWTGFYTSRPTLKYFERQGNNFLQICKQIGSLAQLGAENTPDIDVLREAMGIMQHHDAITGTEKQHVADDYARILTHGLKKCEMVIGVGLNKLMSGGNSSVPPLPINSCPLLNISECSISSESQKFIATVYNPLSNGVKYYVRLPVSSKSFSVKTPNGVDLPYQVVPIPESLVAIPGRNSKTTLELVFMAFVSPLGFQSYYISALPDDELHIEPEPIDNLDEIVIGNEVKITFNGTTGLLSSLGFDGKTISISQSLEYYVSATGDNHKFENRSSGAYIFRPKKQTSDKISTKPSITVYKGPIVTEIHQVFSTWASQVVRQYSLTSYVENEWLIGPIPNADGEGKEIISRYSTELKTGGLFYTDSNGRQTLERKRNHRPSWVLDLKEPVAGNYYPITTDISINDKETELTVVVDRAEGGSSLKDGDVELMLHRRLFHDDAFGVDEALNESAFGKGLVARGRHWLLAGSLSNPAWQDTKRLLIQEKVLSPQVFLTSATSIDFNHWSTNYKLEYSGITEALPPEIKILTLEPWKQKSYLLRLEYIIESGTFVDVDLSKLFTEFEIVSAKETSLGADRWLDEVSRFKWRKETNEILENESSVHSNAVTPPIVRLTPRQIRTFVCEIKPKNSI